MSREFHNILGSNRAEKNAELNYRHDIDGLRALAVICVVVYHAKFEIFNTTLMTGGYVGVDIFFVISGYLITRIILNDIIHKKDFNFYSFLERRARRILPVLFCVIITTALLALFKSLPSDYVDFFRSLVASVFFYSNFYFYKATTVYGADSSLKEPLLHTWSLGVEEQFYIVFPILTLLMQKFVPKYFSSILLSLCIISLFLAQFLEIYNADLNFYLPFSRFWELGLGAFVAYQFLSRSNNGLVNAKIFSLFGFGLVIFSIYYFDEKTHHPGFFTLLPVIGTCFLIMCDDRKGLLYNLLSNKIINYLGRISFSVYLWHFPLFALARQNGPEPSNILKLFLIFFTIALSTISYRFIEQPFRNAEIIGRKSFLFTVSMTLVVVMLSYMVVLKKEGFPDRFESGWMNYELDDGKLRQNFWKYFNENVDNLKIPSEHKINVYVFGNSHAGDLLGGLLSKSDIYSQFNFLKVVRNEQLACFDEQFDEFRPHREALYSSDAYKKTEIFIIATRFVNAKCDKFGNQSANDASGLRYLIPKLLNDGKKIIIMGNTLVLKKIEGQWVEEWIYRKAVDDKIDFRSSDAYIEYARFSEKLAFRLQSEENLETNKRLQEFAEDNNLSFFSRQKLFCSELQQTCKVFLDDGSRLRYDYGHLTLEGKLAYGELLINSGFLKFLYDVHSRDMNANNYVEYGGSL